MMVAVVHPQRLPLPLAAAMFAPQHHWSRARIDMADLEHEWDMQGIDVQAFLSTVGLDGDGEGWDTQDDADELDEAEELATAASQHTLLSGRTDPLSLPDAHIPALESAGVVRVSGALSEGTAAALRAFILAEVATLEGEAEAVGAALRGEADQERFSQVLSAAAAQGEPPTRWDLRLAMVPEVEAALAELLTSDSTLTAAFTSVSGGLEVSLLTALRSS